MRLIHFCFIIPLIINLPAFAQIEIPFGQMVRRDDIRIAQALQGTKGILKLGHDSIEFQAVNGKTGQ